MDYKYQRRQIFGKRLKVPKHILNKVYNCTISFNEFIEYQLDDKIPTSCIIKSDRRIVEKFGIDKCKELDWELINKIIYDKNINLRDILMSIDPQTDDINLALYELVKDQIRPSYYSSKMTEIYSDRLFEVPAIDYEGYYYSEDITRTLKTNFNDGKVSLEELVSNWELFKDKDLSYCLLNDEKNSNHITDEDLKRFMSLYSVLAPLIVENNDIYVFISNLSNLSSDEEKFNYLKQFTDDILSNTKRQYGDYRPPIVLTVEQYKEIFKYSSLEEYLKTFHYGYLSKELIKELQELQEDYLFNMPIPFSVLLNYDVLSFIGTYGLRNVVDFDNECGHFFTKNNCAMLKLMNDMYLHYASNESNPNKTFFTKNAIDENGNYIDRPYTKDEFYEAMRRMIIYGPSDWDYRDKAPDYREMTGEFKVRNAELFISEQAPEELQKLFDTKSITPQILLAHPEYIQYLNGKDLNSYLKEREIKIKGSDTFYSYENIYEFVSSKTDFNGVMNFITEYCDVLDIVFDRSMSDNYHYEPEFSINDDIDKIQDRLHEALRKLIIEKGIAFPKHIPEALIKKYPSMFLDKNAPQELQDAFYSRTISTEFILSNPLYREYLKNIDLEVLFKFMLVNAPTEEYRYRQVNLISSIKQIFGPEDGFDVMLLYGKYIEKIFKDDKLKSFKFNPSFSKDDLLDEMDNTILQSIIDGNMKYDENIPSHFKNNNPTLFLGADVLQEIKDKFYNREFTLKDFDDNPELFAIFENTNIACAFPENMSWIIPLFNDSDSFKKSNYNRLKIISVYSKIQDFELQNIFKKYIIENEKQIDIEKVDVISEVLSRLEYSNSIEISLFKNNLANKLIATDDPIGNLKKIESIFLRNNLPLCGKMFLCFQILYPNMSEIENFNFSSESRVAPELKDETLPNVGFHASNDEKRLIIIFNDLLRVSYRSNERSLIEYLNNIEEGNKIYLELKNNNFDISKLNDSKKEILKIFVSHLEVLYENTVKGKEENLELDKLSLEEKIKILSKKFSETDRYDLKDRIVRSFCYVAGIKSFDELKQLVNGSLKEQEERIDKNLQDLEQNNGIFKIEEGDIIRGIGYLDSLSGSINSGNFSKEHLGVFLGKSSSDTTPLDVDLTLVTKTDNLYEAVKGTPTGFGFGNVYIIIKKDNPNFYRSRDKDGNLTGAKYDPTKVEMFGTSTSAGGYETHWGARTGISLADVDYILFKERRTINDEHPYDENGNVNYNPATEGEKEYINELEAIKFEIAKNGYYIPVIDFSGKLIFTKEEFKAIRSKMQGLSYYNENAYELSEELISDEVLEIASTLTEEAETSTVIKRNQVNEIVKQVLAEMGLDIKYKLTGDLSSKSVEFIDTGSTGRGTNVPYDGDFDFYMRLDADIIRKTAKLDEFRKRIEEKFKEYGIKECIYTGKGDMRIKEVHLKDGNIVDVDISFGVKTNKVKYSSDECLKDRLSTIKRLYPEQYKYVVANIILAKKFLKQEEVNAYKPRRTDEAQGGLGGVGVENWILQNGGSFIQACRTFLAAATDEKTGKTIPFEEFKKKYQIWDFGENHFSARKNGYLYDNFIENNMNEKGYEKMVQAFKKYLNSELITEMDSETIKR